MWFCEAFIKVCFL